MNFTISKEFDFDAAHSLPTLPEGHKCRRLHGHTYRVQVILRAASFALDQHGFVVDYAHIAEAWAPLHEVLDHRNLNDVLPRASTTENLASHIFTSLSLDKRIGPLLWAVRVHESSTTWCEVTR